jgi:endothelin-converting enzyme/putative endopeptidase
MSSIRNLTLIVLYFSAASFAQTATAPQPATTDKTPQQLDHFNANSVDTAVDPCTDFYQYTCNRWIKDNPVPADEIFWGSFGKLQLWNTRFVHQTVLEVAAKPESPRSPIEQKVGDYWTACTDEKQRTASSLETLLPEIEKIDRMNSKGEIAEIIADLHLTIYGAWNPSEPRDVCCAVRLWLAT